MQKKTLNLIFRHAIMTRASWRYVIDRLTHVLEGRETDIELSGQTSV